VGFNTDADAIIRSLKEDLGLEIRGKRIVIFGAGGAGRAAALRIAQEQPAELWLYNRTESKATEVAAQIEKMVPSVKPRLAIPKTKVNLLLNATSLGLKPDDPMPIQGCGFDLAQATAVYDMIYRPAETPLLQAAKAAGCKTANGLGMLLYQGAKALEIWSAKTAPIEVMRQALHRHVYGHV
jgi:shikimate dehydrogenase